jgi:hypothetical protein
MRFRALVAALGLAAGAFAACTTFDGLSAREGGNPPPNDSGHPGDSGGSDSPVQPDATPKQTSFTSLQDAVKICALAMQCPKLPQSVQASLAIPLDTMNFSLCVDWLAGPLPPNRVGVANQATELQCVAKGQTCLGALACISQEFLDDTDPRCKGLPDAGLDAAPGTYQYCDDGGSVVRCDPQFLHDVLHCNSGYYSPGSTCTRGSDGTKTCSSGADCPQTTCSGNLLVFCGINNTHQGQNCAIEGLTCGEDVTDDSGIPTCLTTDRYVSCSAQGTDCAGPAATVCDGFQRSQFDCDALGGTCTKAAGTARCKRPNDACAPDDPTINQCSATTISLCVGGKATSIDCATVGLKCVPGNASVSGHCG